MYKLSIFTFNLDGESCEHGEKKVIWAQIPGIPNTMRWPVKVVDFPLVYCNSDNAWLRLKGKFRVQAFEDFPNSMDKWISAAEKALKRKPDTLTSFKEDVEWALKLILQDSVGKDGNESEGHQEIDVSPDGNKSDCQEEVDVWADGYKSDNSHINPKCRRPITKRKQIFVSDSDDSDGPHVKHVNQDSHKPDASQFKTRRQRPIKKRKKIIASDSVGHVTNVNQNNNKFPQSSKLKKKKNIILSDSEGSDCHHMIESNQAKCSTPRRINNCIVSDTEDSDEEELKAPSNAIKFGFDIKRMLSAKLSKAIIAEDEKEQKEAVDFKSLMEIEWGLRVTRLANRALEVQSDIIAGNIQTEASQALINEVYPIMKGDEVSKVAKADDLIVNLGNQWFRRNRGNEVMRKYYTSTVMRLAAKLKMGCQKLSKTELDMSSYLTPKFFETVLRAAISCCHENEEDEEKLKAPSNAIKLGFDIKRMLSAKLSKAIIAEDEKKQKQAVDFKSLMEIEWGLRVTRLERSLLVERSVSKRNDLPRPSDVKKLFQYLKEELSKLNLKESTYTTYRRAVTLTLARLTLYNRRSCHEVQAMRLKSYSARTTGVDEIGLEIRKELTDFEHVLLTTQEVVVIRGKTGKGVPVILPGDVKEAMTYITNANIRSKAGIPEENKYVFGSTGNGVFRAYDAIREVAESPEAGLEMPDLVRTSNMRKYMATMLQAFDTTEAERQWVLDHLGHTLNVHRTHYRQTSDVLERIDVAKILLIQDLGLVSKYRGKKLEDIQIDDMVTEVKGGETPKSSESSAVDILEVMEDNTLNESEDEMIDFNGIESSEEEENVTRKKRKSNKPNTRQKWTDDEVNELKNLFSEEFRTNSLLVKNK